VSPDRCVAADASRAAQLLYDLCEGEIVFAQPGAEPWQRVEELVRAVISSPRLDGVEEQRYVVCPAVCGPCRLCDEMAGSRAGE
jgi:hypothetical protein